MSQPEWQCVWSTDHSAIFVDTTGVYEPEMEVAEELGSEEGDGYELFRFTLERKQICCGADDCPKTNLVPFGFPNRPDLPYPIHKYKEWFSDDLADAAASHGVDAKELREYLCSEDHRQRARAYEAIGGHWGYNNLDHYPLTLTDEEFDERVEQRWKES